MLPNPSVPKGSYRFDLLAFDGGVNVGLGNAVIKGTEKLKDIFSVIFERIALSKFSNAVTFTAFPVKVASHAAAAANLP